MTATRVLQVITDTDRRGAQTFAADLAPALERLGHQVTTVALRPGSNDTGLDVEVLGGSLRSALRPLRRAARGADVVVAHGSSTLVANAVVSVGSSTPFVYRQISDPLFWAGTPIRRARVWAYLRRARLVVALSPVTEAIVSEHLGVSPAKIRVIPNGVPAQGHEPASVDEVRSARERLGLGDAPTIGYVGALVPEKGVDLAIVALVDIPEAQLVVAGAGGEREHLEHLAHSVAPGRVHFVGSVPDPGVVYAASDVLVLPSRGGDTMPAVLIEAAFCGVPTVTTPVGAITDVVRDAATGIVVPVGDHAALSTRLAELLRDPSEAHRLGQAARRWCLEQFEIDVVARSWSRVLDEATA